MVDGTSWTFTEVDRAGRSLPYTCSLLLGGQTKDLGPGVRTTMALAFN